MTLLYRRWEMNKCVWSIPEVYRGKSDTVFLFSPQIPQVLPWQQLDVMTKNWSHLRGSHSSVCEYYFPVGRDTVWSGRNLLMFHNNCLTSSSCYGSNKIVPYSGASRFLRNVSAFLTRQYPVTYQKTEKFSYYGNNKEGRKGLEISLIL